MSPCIIKWDPPRPSLVLHYRAPLFDILPVTWMRALKTCTSIYGSHKAGRVGKNSLVELFKVVVASVRGKTSNFRAWAPWKVLPYSCKVWCSIQQAPFHTVTQGTRDLCLQLTKCWDLKHSPPAGRWRRRNGGGPQGRFERPRLRSGVSHLFPCVIGQNLAIWAHIEGEVSGHEFCCNYSPVFFSHVRAEAGFTKVWEPLIRGHILKDKIWWRLISEVKLLVWEKAFYRSMRWRRCDLRASHL